ncbi:hypothetical protein [Subtercola endophyticus]|uniref:hypothetical protein n=1 Tax=Subtercola endophyticus TaxID=2895559 RepID=UPI001E49A049|nr:hypothetical protein [Subtercola endophyticus]UFS59486.1 hypothetical protein LQ955_01405 [Subtercola endophyticus]
MKRLFGEGLGRNQIAAAVGVSAGTVTKLCVDMGLSFDRSATKAATSARVTDLKARKLAIVERLYARSEKILDRLEADTYTYRMPTEFGSELVHDDDPPADAERNLSSSISTYLVSAQKIESQFADPGLAKVRSMMEKMAEALGLADE